MKRCLPESSHEQLGPTFPIINRMASNTAIAATKTIRHIKTTRIIPSFLLLLLCLACLCEVCEVRVSFMFLNSVPGPTLSYTTSGPLCCLGLTALFAFLCSVLYVLFDPASSYNLFPIVFKLVLLVDLRSARRFELAESAGLSKPFSYRAICQKNLVQLQQTEETTLKFKYALVSKLHYRNGRSQDLFSFNNNSFAYEPVY